MNKKVLCNIVALSMICIVSCSKEVPRNLEIADKTNYLSDISSLLQVSWPENRTINIVCHGHSVPAGYFQTPVVDTFNAYPQLLHKELKNRYPHAVINVIVTAIGGEDSASGAKRFQKDVLTHKPDMITIDYALNDRGQGLAAAKKAWSTMIEVAKANDIKVILLTPTPDTRANLEDPEDPLNKHAEQIRNLAKQYNVALVDSLAVFKAYIINGCQLKDMMAQVNHPNRKGHDLVTKELVQWFSYSEVAMSEHIEPVNP